MLKHLPRRLGVPLAAALLAGCAGNGQGLDSNGQPIGPGSAPDKPLTAEFQSIQDNIFTPKCVRCHSGGGAPEGLQLDAAHSYALLVGVPSAEVPALQRVKASDPDSSYLVQKLEGSSGILGERMPRGGPYLPQATIDVIREWIANGAPAPSEVLLRVDSAPDISTQLASASLKRSGGDNTFGDGNEIPLDAMTIELRSSNPTVIALSLPPDRWVPDTYELTVGDHVLPFTIEAVQ